MDVKEIAFGSLDKAGDGFDRSRTEKTGASGGFGEVEAAPSNG